MNTNNLEYRRGSIDMNKINELENTKKEVTASVVKKKPHNGSHMEWAWIIMIGFLTLGIADFRFGILGIACMGAPVYHALRGRGKVHCSKYCPRGSLLGKMLESVSLNRKMPKFMTTKAFKNGLLVAMLSVFSFAMYHAGFNFRHIAFAMFRFMTMSLVIGIIMGIVFKPRSWCVVCPMGHGTGLIDKHFMNKGNKALKPNVVSILTGEDELKKAS